MPGQVLNSSVNTGDHIFRVIQVGQVSLAQRCQPAPWPVNARTGRYLPACPACPGTWQARGLSYSRELNVGGKLRYHMMSSKSGQTQLWTERVREARIAW